MPGAVLQGIVGASTQGFAFSPSQASGNWNDPRGIPMEDSASRNPKPRGVLTDGGSS